MNALKSQSHRSFGLKNRLFLQVARRQTSSSFQAVFFASLLFTVPGCFGPPEFPDEMEVFLTQETSMTAQVNTGPLSMADAEWDISRRTVEGATTPDQSPYGGLLGGGFLDRLDIGERMVRVHFDVNGRAVLASENVFYLPQFLGDTIFLDGELHTAPLIGFSYASTSYGTESGNQVGIAIFVEVRFFGIPSATAVVYAWGPLVDGRIEGVFGYTADFPPLLALLLGSGADQYPVLAERQP